LKRASMILVLLLAVLQISAIDTAEDFFESLSEKYNEINDYAALITISGSSYSTAMRGRIYFLKPDYMQIKFSEPAGQVLAIDGQSLYIYLPQLVVVQQQELKTSGVSWASAEGLAMMKRGYLVAYAESPDPIPLEEGSEERVIKLRLSRKSSSEQFRVLEVSVNPETLLIRRIVGFTVTNETIQMDFQAIETNTGLSPEFFVYEPPKNAYVNNNFLD
jgi:outer membrane lipoprotein-sorting protein